MDAGLPLSSEVLSGTAAVPAPRPHLEESRSLAEQEAALAAEELALAQREVALTSREEAAVEEVVAARAQQSALFGTLQLLAGAGVPGAVEVLASLPPGLVVPPPAARAQAIAARTEAASRRRTGCERRSAILGSVTAGLASNAGLLACATATTAKLAAALAEERRLAAARAEEGPAAPAAAAAEAAPTPAAAAGGAAPTPVAEAAPTPATTGGGAAPAPAAPLAAGPRPDTRRTAERVKFVREIGLHTDSNFFTGFSQNLSSGGLFVAAFDQPLPLGSEVDVTFTLPGGQPVECRAKVRWIRELRDHTPDVWPGMGLEFIDLGSAEQAAVHSFLAAREPLFYPD